MSDDPRPHMQGRPGELGWAAAIEVLQRKNPDRVYTRSDLSVVRERDSNSDRGRRGPLDGGRRAGV